jgi:ABC-2 type transport system ATP-binding protein
VREPARVREHIGLAGQYAAVDENLTGFENLEMVGRLYHLGRRAGRERARELLADFDLAEAGERLVRTYSGGMRRRLDIAAALVPKPPILFLDEPTTGLDLHSRNELWTTIRHLVNDGTSVLLTTQYLEEADRLADRVAVIDHGRVIANDTPAALKAGLGSTVAEMGFDDEARAERARELLARTEPAIDRQASTVRLTTNDGARVLIDVLRVLDGAALTPSSLAVHEPSLDDVFLALTGHRAAQDEPEQAAVGSGAPERRAG